MMDRGTVRNMLLLTCCLQTCMTYTIAVCTVKNSRWWAEELSETCSCSQAVCRPVWHIPLLCVRWKTPDDGQRNCPKHAPAHKLSADLYDIYHCCVYSEKLPMMGRETVRNMLLLTCCLQTCMTYTIAVCTVKNSRWWTEELSETC